MLHKLQKEPVQSKVTILCSKILNPSAHSKFETKIASESDFYRDYFEIESSCE